MTEKVEKIKAKIREWVDVYDKELKSSKDDTRSLIITGKLAMLTDLISFIYSLQEEPVSEDLEYAADKFVKSYTKGGTKQSWLEEGYIAGAKWQKNHLWKPADGDDLPEYDREVVVFTQNFPNDAGMMMVAIGHRPNPDGWDGKSLSTGKVEHYTPKTYDKGGWNIPDVKIWLDVELPKEIEL